MTEVRAEPEYRLFVRFNDGLNGHVQLRLEELTGVLEPLRDPEFFGKVFIDGGAVAWPGDVELAPDAMHAEVSGLRGERGIIEEFAMSSQTVAPNTEAAILARLIEARDSMSGEVAEYLLSFDFAESDIDRMNLLAEQARNGTLTADESTELDSYLHVGSLLSIMQSKARRL